MKPLKDLETLKKMATEKKPSIRRGEMAFIFAIILGLALGIIVKRVKLGILLGLIIGGAIVALGWLRSTRR
ncbi:MAG: hypothetical protein JNK14_08810 [Chitinophagaceae bacterium]|nr:hypothetical protein [Chitinophagaceae bacterium]